jgi:hypothetical protein
MKELLFSYSLNMYSHCLFGIVIIVFLQYQDYCYPAIIFSILIGLILITICISACDYRYLRKDQELKVIQQKTVSLENKDDEEKSISEKVSQKSEDDDDVSITSTDSETV